MKYLPLILANLSRKKTRTALMTASYSVALFLFALLSVIRGSFSQNVQAADAYRLIVVNKTSLVRPLPLSYRDRLLTIPGVVKVNYATYFAGVYQDGRSFFPQFAVDTETQQAMFPECIIPNTQWTSFVQDREGAVVGEGLAKRFGRRIGDRIPLRGTRFPGLWLFNIRGIFRGRDPAVDVNQFWFHWKYLDEKRFFQKGAVGFFNIRIAESSDPAELIRKVDDEFANSTWETKTATEKSFALSWVRQFGNIEFLISMIGTVGFITLILVTGNTMMLAVRERIGEIAILRALGFSGISLAILVLGESGLIAVAGGTTGILLAKMFTLNGDPTHGLLPYFYLPTTEMAAGVVISLCTGILAGAWPARQAMRLQVAEALRWF